VVVRLARRHRWLSRLKVMWAVARSLWAEPAATNPPPRDRWDWIFAAVVMAIAASEAVLRADVVWPPAALAVGCALAVAILNRRARPLMAVALAFGTFAAADIIWQSPISSPWCSTAGAPYSCLFTAVPVGLRT
jgi:hypothetical protein